MIVNVDYGAAWNDFTRFSFQVTDILRFYVPVALLHKINTNHLIEGCNLSL